jgi:Zn/Cd-binding protein ZinT
MINNIKAQHWILKWMDNNPNHTKEEALIALEKAKQIEKCGTMENSQDYKKYLSDNQIEYLAEKQISSNLVNLFQDEKDTLNCYNPNGFTLEWMLIDAYLKGAKMARTMLELRDKD